MKRCKTFFVSDLKWVYVLVNQWERNLFTLCIQEKEFACTRFVESTVQTAISTMWRWVLRFARQLSLWMEKNPKRRKARTSCRGISSSPANCFSFDASRIPSKPWHELKSVPRVQIPRHAPLMKKGRWYAKRLCESRSSLVRNKPSGILSQTDTSVTFNTLCVCCLSSLLQR